MRLSFRERGGATGNLEVCTGNNQWRFICGNSFGSEELDVACRSLGFDEFGQLSTSHTFALSLDIVEETEDLSFELISCSGDELELSQCPTPMRRKRNVCGVSNPRITCQCET